MNSDQELAENILHAQKSMGCSDEYITQLIHDHLSTERAKYREALVAANEYMRTHCNKEKTLQLIKPLI